LYQKPLIVLVVFVASCVKLPRRDVTQPVIGAGHWRIGTHTDNIPRAIVAAHTPSAIRDLLVRRVTIAQQGRGGGIVINCD
jgi:hypothetical protein